MEMDNAQKVEWLVELVKQVQWNGPKQQAPGHLLLGTCPVCGAHHQHRADCRMAMAVAMKPTVEPVAEE